MAKTPKFQKSAVANTVNGQSVQPAALQMGQPVMLQTQMYQGPVPHPDILRGFDDLVPGAAERLIALAENESIHRRELESRSMEANIQAQQRQLGMGEYQGRAVFRSDAIGQVLGAIVSLFCIGGAVYLALNGQPWVAGILGGLPLAAIVKAFRDKSTAAK